MGTIERLAGLGILNFLMIAVLLGGGLELHASHAPGSSKAGEAIFMESCQHCHGPKGKGDGQMAEYLDPRPKNLTSESTQSKTDDELRKVIIEGRPGTAMAGVEDSLEDTELIDLIAYIRTLKP